MQAMVQSGQYLTSQTVLKTFEWFVGYMEEEKEGMEGEAMRATEVLKAIEKCIKAFWLYVKTDEKKPWWKFKSLLWTYPPLEDPRDLKLFSHLSNTLQQVSSNLCSH